MNHHDRKLEEALAKICWFWEVESDPSRRQQLLDDIAWALGEGEDCEATTQRRWLTNKSFDA
jgi:hypothetical protein